MYPGLKLKRVTSFNWRFIALVDRLAFSPENEQPVFDKRTVFPFTEHENSFLIIRLSISGTGLALLDRSTANRILIRPATVNLNISNDQKLHQNCLAQPQQETKHFHF